MAKTWVAVVLSVMLLVSLNSGPILAEEQPTVGQRTDSAVTGVSNAFKEHGGSDALEDVSSTAKCGGKAKHRMGVKPKDDPPPAGAPPAGAAKPTEKSADKLTRRLTDKPRDKLAGGAEKSGDKPVGGAEKRRDKPAEGAEKPEDKPAGRPTNKPAGKTANKPLGGGASDKMAGGPADKQARRSADKPARGPAVKEINHVDADQVHDYLESLEHKEGKKSKKNGT